MQRAQTSGKISREEMSHNCAFPICTGRRIARWRATAWSDNQTAPGGRAARIWSGLWGNRLFLQATRAVLDDCRAKPPIAWCPILPGRQQNRRAARTEASKSQVQITATVLKSYSADVQGVTAGKPSLLGLFCYPL